jgi:hypothetical protein
MANESPRGGGIAAALTFRRNVGSLRGFRIDLDTLNLAGPDSTAAATGADRSGAVDLPGRARPARLPAACVVQRALA